MLDDNLEDYFKENLENVHTSWDKEAFWDDLEPMLPAEKKRRPIIWFWTGGIAAMLLLSGLAFYLLGTKNTNTVVGHNIPNPTINTPKQNIESTSTKTNTIASNQDNDLIINTKSNSNNTVQNKVNNTVLKTNSTQQNNQITDNTTSSTIIENSVENKPSLAENTLLETATIVVKKAPEQGVIILEKINIPALLANEINIVYDNDESFNRLVSLSKSTHHKLSIMPYLGIGSVNRSLTSSTPNNELLNLRNKQETTLEAVELGIHIRKTLNNGIFVQSGIELSTIHERLNYTQSEIENTTIQSDTASFYQSFTGNIQYRKGEIEVQSVTNTRFERYNQLQSINIPLLLGYEKHIGRLNINLAAGPVFNVHRQYKGFAYNDAMQIVEAEKIDLDQQLNVNSIDALANIDFPICRNVRLMAGMKYRYGLSTSILNSTISQQYKVGSAFIGLRCTL